MNDFPHAHASSDETSLQPVATTDGSITCYHPETGELYHNRSGAMSEAWRNYVLPSDAWETLCKKRHLRVLDICFGLGDNTWVLLEYLLQRSRQLELDPFFEGVDPRSESDDFSDCAIEVVTIESDPVIYQIIPDVLDFMGFTSLKLFSSILEHNIYYQTQNKPSPLTLVIAENPKIVLTICTQDLRKIIPNLTSNLDQKTGFDLIFHDAFSPMKVPQLWTSDLFSAYHALLSSRKGRLLTYSATGAVRGGLHENGFNLYRTQGLGQKTGGTLASVMPVIPDEHRIFALTDAELEYMDSRAGIPFRDPSGQLSIDSTTQAVLALRQKEQAASTRPTPIRHYKQ